MRPWFTAAAALVAAGLGYWAWQQRPPAPTPATPEPPPPPSLDTGLEAPLTHLPGMTYPGLDGVPQDLDQWAGKVLVVNFWATWCPPCRKETPLFVALQDEFKKHGVQFVGIAIDEHDAVQNFVDTYGVEYPILIGDMAAVGVSKRLGNRFSGLPFTVVVDRDGKVVMRHAGGLERDQIEPLLSRLSGAGKGS